MTTEVWTSYTQGIYVWGSINNRFVHAGVKECQWPEYVREMFRILKPGSGWAQCAESGMPHFDCDIASTDSVLPRVIFHLTITKYGSSSSMLKSYLSQEIWSLQALGILCRCFTMLGLSMSGLLKEFLTLVV